MPVIITPGIHLPNRRFLPNKGDGHAKNAIRFCQKYPKFDKLREVEAKFNDADDFMIMSGCAIVAGYQGKSILKVAEDNVIPSIQSLELEYEQYGYKIWPFWKINPEYKNALDEIIKQMSKMQVIIKGEWTMNLRDKTGFVVRGRFYNNNGRGHETTAREIIDLLGWDSEWTKGYAQDFLVCEKGAIQLGSGFNSKQIIVGRDFFNESKVDKVKDLYNLHGYDHQIIR